jgi:hypothetical protein
MYLSLSLSFSLSRFLSLSDFLDKQTAGIVTFPTDVVPEIFDVSSDLNVLQILL